AARREGRGNPATRGHERFAVRLEAVAREHGGEVETAIEHVGAKLEPALAFRESRRRRGEGGLGEQDADLLEQLTRGGGAAARFVSTPQACARALAVFGAAAAAREGVEPAEVRERRGALDPVDLEPGRVADEKHGRGIASANRRSRRRRARASMWV